MGQFLFPTKARKTRGLARLVGKASTKIWHLIAVLKEEP